MSMNFDEIFLEDASTEKVCNRTQTIPKVDELIFLD